MIVGDGGIDDFKAVAKVMKETGWLRRHEKNTTTCFLEMALANNTHPIHDTCGAFIKFELFQ